MVFQFFINFPYLKKPHFQENRNIFEDKWEEVGEIGKTEKNVFLKIVTASFTNSLSIFIPSHLQIICQVYETQSVFRGNVSLSYTA